MKLLKSVIFFIFITNFANADQPYLKFGVSKLKTDYITQDGINYKDVYADEFDVYGITAGYSFTNFFIEGRYFWSSKESKTGSDSSGGVSVSGSTDVELDGYSIGGGYSFTINDKIKIKPSVHYLDIDIDANLDLTIAGSNFSFDAGGKDETIEAKVEGTYLVNEKSEISLSYSDYLDDVTTTKNASTLAIEIKYIF